MKLTLSLLLTASSLAALVHAAFDKTTAFEGQSISFDCGSGNFCRVARLEDWKRISDKDVTSDGDRSSKADLTDCQNNHCNVRCDSDCTVKVDDSPGAYSFGQCFRRIIRQCSCQNISKIRRCSRRIAQA